MRDRRGASFEKMFDDANRKMSRAFAVAKIVGELADFCAGDGAQSIETFPGIRESMAIVCEAIDEAQQLVGTMHLAGAASSETGGEEKAKSIELVALELALDTSILDLKQSTALVASTFLEHVTGTDAPFYDRSHWRLTVQQHACI